MSITYPYNFDFLKQLPPSEMSPSQEMEAAIAAGIKDAIGAILFGLSLAPEERAFIEKRREEHEETQRANVHKARALVAQATRRSAV